MEKNYIDYEYGNFRVIYSIDDTIKTIIITLINNRGDVYKKI